MLHWRKLRGRRPSVSKRSRLSVYGHDDCVSGVFLDLFDAIGRGAVLIATVLFDRQASKIYTSSYEMTLPDEVTQVRREWIPVWSSRAYAEGSVPRTVLSSIGSVAERWPRLPMSARVANNIRDMIDADEATLYRIP